MKDKVDLYTKSEFIEIISGILEKEYGKTVSISRLHEVKIGNGNMLFYVITQENYHFLVNIMGKKVQDDAILYWVENINHAGKVAHFYYERDRFVITFSRGSEYKNEYLAYLYVYGNSYPSIKFIYEEIYSNYLKMIETKYKKHELKLPEDLMVNNKT